jgi:hypothetical protein
VLDSRDRRVLATLPCSDVSDSMSSDEHARILYVSGDDGMSRHRILPDRSVSFLGTDAMMVGKTSLLVAGRHRLFVARPKKPGQVAALQVYAVGK